MNRNLFVFLSACFLMQVSFAQPKLVFVEGNIGAGKSTFLRILQAHLPVILTTEPCDEWQNVAGHNLLQAYYQDGPKWAAIFQMYASMTRIRKQQACASDASLVQIMERSWFSDRFCFGNMLHHLGVIDDLSWQIYCQMWQWQVSHTQHPLAFIYLRVEPEMCFQRMHSRARGEEVGVSLEYLQRLHLYHEQLLVEKALTPFMENMPVLILDGSLNFRDDEAVQRTFVRQILDFLKIHGNIDLTI